jgi:phosphoglycolate phosphatase-like HAD superfamily hydrolase
MIDLSGYVTLVFDCDGVVLNSNRIKTEAFRIAALPWGEHVADSLVAYHVANGGISRYSKFAYFLDTILSQLAPDNLPGIHGPCLDELLLSYAQEVRAGLTHCAVAEGLESLRHQTSDSTWCIVSGGDQAELRQVFAERALSSYFNGGIWGSPDSKDIILAREIESGNIRLPALFLGDSRYDYKVSQSAGLDFIFISKWTELPSWKEFVLFNHLKTVEYLSDLLSH